MKKTLLILFVLLLILGSIFHKQILAAITAYQMSDIDEETLAKATITWDEIPFSSSDWSGLASDSLTFGSLVIPVPFGMSKTVGKDAAMAVGYTEVVTVSSSSAAAYFFRMYNFSEKEKQATCAFLAETSGRGACNSNYDLYRAFLELNETDVHVFTATDDKTLYNRLMNIRAELIPANTVAGFETRSVHGFIFTIDEKNRQVDLFDAKDQQYHLEFGGFKESDVAFVLSNITSAN